MKITKSVPTQTLEATHNSASRPPSTPRVGLEATSRYESHFVAQKSGTAQKSEFAEPSAVRNNGPRGAYYHKVESTSPSKATLGIDTSVTLGRFVSDPSRPPIFSAEAPEGRAQDVMSNYLGTSATATIKGVAVTAESDAGFATSRHFDAEGRPTFVTSAEQSSGTRPSKTYYEKNGKFYENKTNIELEKKPSGLVEHFCSRAFARVHEPVLDASGKVVMEDGKVKYSNDYSFIPKEDQSQYAYQGETLLMKVERKPPPAEGKNVSLSFTVMRLNGTKATSSLSWRSETLAQASALVQAKRVTSVDQRGGEDNGTVPTRATITQTVWNYATVTSLTGVGTPLAGANAVIIHGRDSAPTKTFSTTGMKTNGGQSVTIDPPNPR